jgi:hypothetical protein
VSEIEWCVEIGVLSVGGNGGVEGIDSFLPGDWYSELPAFVSVGSVKVNCGLAVEDFS